MLLPATRDYCHVHETHTHTHIISADVYISIVEFMLNMHILIALSEIISRCIFLSLSSVRELSKQRRAAGDGAPPAAATSTKLIQSLFANYYQFCYSVTQTESQGQDRSKRSFLSPPCPTSYDKKQWDRSEERIRGSEGGWKFCCRHEGQEI